MSDSTTSAAAAGAQSNPTPSTASPFVGTSQQAATSADINDMLSKFFDDFTKKQNERLNNIQHELLNAQQQRQNDYDMMKRLGLAKFAEESKTQRRQTFLDVGMTPDQATIAASEALDGHPTTFISNRERSRKEWKASEIGLFHGEKEQFAFWAGRVARLHNSKIDPQWRDGLIDTLPLCLRGAASNWYIRQTDTKLDTWDDWYSAMSKVFLPDVTDLKHRAEKRKWDPKTEDASSYVHEKLTLLQSAFPGHTAKDLVIELKEGLPDAMQGYIRTDLAKNPTVDDFLQEVFHQEGVFRRVHKIGPPVIPSSRRAGSEETRSSDKQSSGRRRQESAPSSTSTSSSPSSSTASGRSLKDSYDPACIFFKGNKRWYRIPGSNSVLELRTPCSRCQGNHFTFEHDYLAMLEAKKEGKKEMLYMAEGYPVFAFEDVMQEYLFKPDEYYTNTTQGTAQGSASQSLAVTTSGSGVDAAASPSASSASSVASPTPSSSSSGN